MEFKSRRRRDRTDWLDTLTEDTSALVSTTFLRKLLFSLFTLLFVHDACYNALGSTNGRFISLVDTINTVCSFRLGLSSLSSVPSFLPSSFPLLAVFPASLSIGAKNLSGAKEGDNSGISIGKMIWVLFMSFVVKFLAQTLVSLLLGTTPVVLKGSRHVSSFLLGFLLAWFSPRDVVFRNVRKSLAVQLVMSMACGLYKLRKAIFAVEQARQEQSLFFAIAIMTVAVDGNTMVRRMILHALKKRMSLVRDNDDVDTGSDNNDAKSDQGKTNVKVNKVIDTSGDSWARWLRTSQEWLMQFFLPDALVTMLLWGVGSFQSIELRIVLLVYFFHRHGALDVLNKIHEAGMLAVTPPPSPMNAGCKVSKFRLDIDKKKE